MKPKRRRWYAIRMGDYVELRSTVRGLKAIKSTHTYTMTTGVPITLTQTFLDGGKVEAVFEYIQFLSTAYPYVTSIANDGYKELTKEIAVRLIERGTKWSEQ